MDCHPGAGGIGGVGAVDPGGIDPPDGIGCQVGIDLIDSLADFPADFAADFPADFAVGIDFRVVIGMVLEVVPFVFGWPKIRAGSVVSGPVVGHVGRS